MPPDSLLSGSDAAARGMPGAVVPGDAPASPQAMICEKGTRRAWLGNDILPVTAWLFLGLYRNGVVEGQPTAVGVDRLAGDVAGFVGSEEGSDGCDLRRLTDAAERRAR